MMGNLKPYPVYKESGVEWLGEVPAHWQVQWLKRIARLNPSKSEVPLALRDGRAVFLPMERVGSDRRFDASEVRPISDLWNGFTYFRQGDVIVAKITPCFENGKGACLENLPTALGFGSTEFHVIRPSKAVISAYLYRVTTLSEFRRLGADEMTGAAGQQRVPIEFIENFAIPIPPLPEQTAIERFLDYMDQRIRRVIRARQRRIKLLEEYKQALIHQAVTGQIDVRTGKPYLAYKESGVEWMGQVPAHWEMRKLRALFTKAGSGSTPSGEDFYGGEIPWVVTGDLNDSVLSNTTRTVNARALDTISALRLYPRDSLIIAMYGATIGKTAILGIEACTNQACCILAEPHKGVLVRFIQSAVISAKGYLVRQGYGGGQPNINSEIVHSLRIPMPPAEEQTAIVEYLDAQMANIDAAISASRREIDLLREYRTRLISDVVTGKVDVREVAAQLPEEPAEEEEPLGTEDAEATADEETDNNEETADAEEAR
ncbi:MAG: restriction endonuclease subunit S [Bryobacteraceae bacterium]